MAGTTKGRKSWKASCSESEAHRGLGLRGVKPLWRTDARFKMTRFSEVSRRFYVLHSVVPFEEDTTHEFKGHRNISIEEIPPWCFIPGTDRRSRKAVSRWAKIFSVQENDWGFNIAISEILNFEEITIKIGEKKCSCLMHTWSFGRIQFASRCEIWTVTWSSNHTESNNPALPRLHLQNFQIFLKKEDNFTLKRGIEDQLP